MDLLCANSTEPPKLSKSQLKKLQKHARTERRKQAKAAAKGTTAENSPRATPSLEQSIARSEEVADEEVLSSEADDAPPEPRIETEQKDASPAPEPPRPNPESSSSVSAAIKSDSMCTLFCGVSVPFTAYSQLCVPYRPRHNRSLLRNCKRFHHRHHKRMSSVPLRLSKTSRMPNARRNAKIWSREHYGRSS